MHRRLRGSIWFVGWLCLCFTVVRAQTLTCADIVTDTLASVEAACAATTRNQACYGNVSIAATPRANAVDFDFDGAGDLANVVDVATMRLRALNVEENVWGVALMQLQANLPDTLPGQNVTFLLFGDVEIENAVPEDDAETFTPMQAFYFRAGILDPVGCNEAPPNGMLIQTPEGIGEITLRANEVDIRLGSTAFVEAVAEGDLTISVIEGQGTITASGVTAVVPAGARVSVPLDEDVRPTGAPGAVTPYALELLANLPISLLPREIEIAPPADEAAIAAANGTAGGGFGLPSMGAPLDMERIAAAEAMSDAEFCAMYGGTEAGGEFAAFVQIALLALSPMDQAQAQAFFDRIAACP